MDRIQINCMLSAGQTNLQLDVKKIPDESGPCFMITHNGLFKGYVSRQRNGNFTVLGHSDFSVEDLNAICESIAHLIKSKSP